MPHDFLTNADHRTEAEPNYVTRIFIAWWNDHFEEVARHEPEYERLNEIMKWSQLIGWLNTEGNGSLLGFLKNVPDEKPQQFPDWARKHPELTFRNWDAISFLPQGYAGTSTEALPILHTPSGRLIIWRGGVSLARREALAFRASLTQKVPASARRGAVDFAESGVGEIQMLNKSKFIFKPVEGNVTKIIAHTGPKVRLRGIFGEIKNTHFETVIERTPHRFVLQTRAAGAEVGELRISPSTQGFKIGWRSRDVDWAQTAARRLSIARDDKVLQILQSDPAVKSVILVPGKGISVELSGSGRWIRFTAGSRDSQVISPGCQARIAEADPKAFSIDVAWTKTFEVPADLPGESFIRIKPASAVTEAPIVEFGARGPPEGVPLTNFTIGGKRLPGHIDPKTGSYYIRYRDLPPDLHGNPGRLAELGAGGGGGFSDTARLQQILGKRDYFKAAREVAADPDKFRVRFKAFLGEQLKQNDAYLARGQFDLASRQMDDLIFFYGKHPDFMARKGLAELSAGKPERAIASLQEADLTPMREYNAFFDEVNLRIRGSIGNKPIQENLHHLAAISDWRNYRLQFKPAGDLRPVVKGKQITFEYRTRELPTGKTADLETLLLHPDRPVYIPDGAGINNLDWNPSVQASLRQSISAGKVSIHEIDLVDLAHFRPTVAFGSKPTVTLRLANHEYHAQQSFRYTPVIAILPTSAGQDDEKKRRQRLAYIVVTRASH